MLWQLAKSWWPFVAWSDSHIHAQNYSGSKYSWPWGESVLGQGEIFPSSLKHMLCFSTVQWMSQSNLAWNGEDNHKVLCNVERSMDGYLLYLGFSVYKCWADSPKSCRHCRLVKIDSGSILHFLESLRLVFWLACQRTTRWCDSRQRIATCDNSSIH